LYVNVLWNIFIFGHISFWPTLPQSSQSASGRATTATGSVKLKTGAASIGRQKPSAPPGREISIDRVVSSRLPMPSLCALVERQEQAFLAHL